MSKQATKRSARVTDLPTWDEMAERLRADDARAREQATLLYQAMVDHVEREAARTGARLQIMDPGTVLPKQAGEAPLAMRMDVTQATVLYARQPHVTEPREEKHRSWRIDLELAPSLPPIVSRGLSRMVEQVATMQGSRFDKTQPQMDLD